MATSKVPVVADRLDNSTPRPKIQQLNDQISRLNVLVTYSITRAIDEGFIPFGTRVENARAFEAWKNRVKDALEDAKAERSRLLNESDKNERTQIENRVAATKVPTVTGQRLNTRNSGELVTNVGLVTEAYLSPLKSFRTAFNLSSNNRPTKVSSADQLWSNSAGHKGLIQTFVPRSGLSSVSFDAFLPADVKSSVQQRWGFQFHYNPGSIDMTYAGIPDIDVGYVASGQDPFNIVGSQVSQATISFQLVLNRIFDMQYYTPEGRLRADAPPSVYSPSRPSVKDQENIYNRGTMYDVEFLLSTILGFQAATQFRNNTADLGWIGGHPVELYLGKSLKYLAMTQGASLRHIIFNERMVPTFSTLSLTFNRIPDYASATTDGGPSGINQTTPAAPPPPNGGSPRNLIVRPV